jgi:hypothetical protein
MAVMEKKEHRYGKYKYSFDNLCDAGCTRPVPYGADDNQLRRWGWRVEDDPSYIDGKQRTCAACAEVEKEE